MTSREMKSPRVVPIIFTALAALICCLLVYHRHVSASQDPFKCQALATNGSWSNDFHSLPGLQGTNWMPTGCMLHTYTSADVEQCVNCNSLLFVGDSMTRQIFWATAKKLNSTRANFLERFAPKHENLFFSHGCSTLEFLWDPFLNLTSTASLLAVASGQDTGGRPAVDTHPIFALIGVGLWYARHLEEKYLEAFDNSINKILPYLRQPATLAVESCNISHATSISGPPLNQETFHFAFLPVLTPFQPMLALRPDRVVPLGPGRIQALNRQLHSIQEQESFDILWSFLSMIEGRHYAYEGSGIHVVEKVASITTDLFLNLRCNSGSVQKYPFSTTCCAPSPNMNGAQQFLIALAALTVFVWLIVSSMNTALSGIEAPRTNPGSSFRPLTAIAVFSLVLMYCFTADRTLYFSKISRIPSQSCFITFAGSLCLLCMVSLVLPGARSQRSEKAPLFSPKEVTILSRQQTEEWKGWMQVAILCYHYFGMSKTLWVYQLIRLLVASYLFMTGYGHTTYYLKTGDYSFKRVCAVLLRLNLLSCALPYFMATDYDFYYFPALISFWFLVIYLTMIIWSQVWKQPSMSTTTCCFTISAILTRELITHPGFLEAIFSLARTLFRMNINTHEFRFRVSLDMYIVYFGMLFGFYYWKIQDLPLAYWRERWPKISSSPEMDWKFLALFPTAVILSYAYFCRQFDDKFAYNVWHPVTSVLPILSFVVLRNVTKKLQSWHVPAFAWIGRCSLETYILQYHIWLAADTKGLLHLPFFDNPKAPPSGVAGRLVMWTEFGIITVYFVLASWALGRATTAVTVWMTKPESYRWFGMWTKLAALLCSLLILNWVWPN